MVSPVGQNVFTCGRQSCSKFLHVESRRKSLINGTYVYRTWTIHGYSESTECNFALNR